jgi:hypothetical protein
MSDFDEHDVRRHSNPDTFLNAPIDSFEAAAEPLPPGTKAEPRPLNQERPEVAALVAKIESALETIHSALAEIKRIQNPPQTPLQPQSKAG